MKARTKTFLEFASVLSLMTALTGIGLSTSAGAENDDGPPVQASKAPKVVLISLDGARPDLIQQFLNDGTLPPNGGLARVNRGVVARQNVTATPSLTAVAHQVIATGSTAARLDIPANTFHPEIGRAHV